MIKLLYKNDSLKLAIEEDSCGFYFIVYRNPQSEKSTEDYLIDSLEEAFEEAQEKFGVSKEKWTLQK